MISRPENHRVNTKRFSDTPNKPPIDYQNFKSLSIIVYPHTAQKVNSIIFDLCICMHEYRLSDTLPIILTNLNKIIIILPNLQ